MLKKFRELLVPTNNKNLDFTEKTVTVKQNELILRKSRVTDTLDYMNLQKEVYYYQPWPAQIVQMELRNKKALYLSLEHSKKLVGFIGVSIVNDAEVHITNIAVSPDFQRQGIGHLLINQVMDYFRNLGYKQMSLEVDTTNTDAIRLYEAFSFNVRKLQEKYYVKNNHDAYEMITDL
ncbi:ribosomal protein S18-alanine N-acetyltransferase [Companilactobacillus metriopterae]|uniref:ribosomal protein S18-alanine N-acetyltransferase n=1 Tax=Companilactobacillus metriopterae TaxID=1909267 RepID=UPI0013E99291|nr:ribosomal protein S18-alanine N-acetyltransferase [Companilactobacillus metriopterae]